jgi:glycerol dehydrogenase-like iron-containing ADH family enzyme
MNTKNNNYDMNEVFGRVDVIALGTDATWTGVLDDEDTARVTIECSSTSEAASMAAHVLSHFMHCVPEVQVSLTTHGDDIEFTFTRSLYVEEES